MKFKYKALKENGETYEDTAHAENKQALYRKLKSTGETLVTATKVSSSDTGELMTKINQFLSRVSEQDKIMFARNLGAMIEAGLPIARALSVIRRQANNPALEKILSDVDDTIQGGEQLSAGLAKHPDVFSSLFVHMVRAGEESGELAESLALISDQIERSYKLKKKIRGAMMYPAIIVVAMILVGITMLIYVVPTLTSTFKEMDADLPASTQFIIAVSDFLKNYTVIAFGSIIAAAAGFWGALQTDRGKRAFEWTILHMPLIAPLVKQTNSARTARTLSSLLDSGVEVVRAIDITQGVIQNSYYKEVLEEAKLAVKNGNSIAGVFQRHENLYPPFVGEMVAVGEETGSVAKLLKRVGTFYEEEVQRKTKDMSTIIEPFLMVVIGIVVGFFAVSMITPMYSLTSNI